VNWSRARCHCPSFSVGVGWMWSPRRSGLRAAAVCWLVVRVLGIRLCACTLCAHVLFVKAGGAAAAAATAKGIDTEGIVLSRFLRDLRAASDVNASDVDRADQVGGGLRSGSPPLRILVCSSCAVRAHVRVCTCPCGRCACPVCALAANVREGCLLRDESG
jgi:hypothetical protein